MPSPQQVNWAKLRSAAVVVAGLLILGTLAYLLTGGTFMEARSTIYLYLPDATGVTAKAPVRVDGISVGKVERVELSGSNEPNRVVRVTLSVESDRLANITSDSTADTTTDTLVGDKFIDVSSGSSTRHLQAGGELAYKGGGDVLQRLDLAQFQKRLHAIELVLDDIEQGKGPLGAFIQGDALYNDLRNKVIELHRGIQVAADTTTAVGRALYTDTLYRKAMAPLRRLDETLASLQAGQGSGGALLRDPAQYDQAAKQVAELRQSIGTVRGGELMTSDAAYRDWSKRIDGILRQVEDFRASPLMTTPAVYDNLTGMGKELAAATKEFREDPRKFLRLKIF